MGSAGAPTTPLPSARLPLLAPRLSGPELPCVHTILRLPFDPPITCGRKILVKSSCVKAEVHYRRGTLVESRPCWQVVPLPSPVVSSTRSDEHLSDPQSFCHSSSLPFPRSSLHSHPPSPSVSPSSTPWYKNKLEMPSLLYLLFHDAFSDHALFFCV